MIIENQAEVGREDFAIDIQFWTRRKIRHPQVIDKGRLKGFRRSGLQPSAPQCSCIIAFGTKEPVEGPERGELLTGLDPALVEHLQRNLGILTYLAQEPLANFDRHFAKNTLITTAFRLEGGKTSTFPGIPIIFQGACRRIEAVFVGPWTQRGQAQGLDHANTLTHLLFNEAHRGKSPQGHLVFAVLKVLTHVPASLPPVPTSIKQQRCVGSISSSLRPIVARSVSTQNSGCRQR